MTDDLKVGADAIGSFWGQRAACVAATDKLDKAPDLYVLTNNGHLVHPVDARAIKGLWAYPWFMR